MKSARKILGALLVMVLVFGAVPVIAAETGTQQVKFDLITQVYDFGQRVSALRIDLGQGETIGAKSVFPASFIVYAEAKTADGTVYFNNRRNAVSAYVNMDGEYGVIEDAGRYVFVELDTPSKRNADGTITNLGSETYLNGEKLALNYTVTWPDHPGVELAQGNTINLIVDDFQKGSIENNGSTLAYRYYDPSGEYAAPEKGFPLVLFLHGEDGAGSDNEKQLVNSKGATLWVEMPKFSKLYGEPSYVLAPQIQGQWEDSGSEALLTALLDKFVADNKVDPGRVYVQGYSMGGVGAWNMIVKHADRFAGAMAISGYAPAELYDNGGAAFEAVKNMPIWAFVVANDEEKYVGGTERAVTQIMGELRAAQGLTGATKYEVWGQNSVLPVHNAWEHVYRVGTPYNWLLSQSRERNNNMATRANTQFTQYRYNDEIISVCDYEMDQLWVLDKGDKAMIIDSAQGDGDLYEYVRNNVLRNPNAEITVFITHNHGDHYVGLKWFADNPQLKTVYVHAAESRGTEETLGSNEKFQYVKDGDVIDFADEKMLLLTITGHTTDSTVLFYKDNMFTGDAVGSGDLWLSSTTMNVLVSYLEKFITGMEKYKADNGYDLLTMHIGHRENKETYYDNFIYDLLAAAKGAVDGTIPSVYYTRRGNPTTFSVGVNNANIRYFVDQAYGADGDVVESIKTTVDTLNALNEASYTEDSYNKFKEEYERILTIAMLTVTPNATSLGNYSFLFKLKDEPAQNLLKALDDCSKLLVLK